MIDVETVLFVLLISLLIVLIFYTPPVPVACEAELIEGLDDTQTINEKTNEALQGIISVYSKDNMSVNNFTSNVVNTPSVKSSTDVSIESSNILLTGNVCSGNVCMKSEDFMKMLSKLSKDDYMYSSDSTSYQIFQDVVSSLAGSPSELSSSKPYAKSGNPNGFESTAYGSGSLWNGRQLLRIGSSNTFPNGLVLAVPGGMSVIWVRVLDDRWFMCQVFDDSGKSLGKFAGGRRFLNNISPDGGVADSYWNAHAWMPVPIPYSDVTRNIVMTNPSSASGSEWDGYISGIAFSTNPWNHAMGSALTYDLAANGGDDLPAVVDDNYDRYTYTPNGKTSTLYVPVVPSGKDKLIYFVDSYDWNSGMHVSLKINDTTIERLKTTYDNPFSRHINSKAPYQRYLASRIPSSLIPADSTFVRLTVDMNKQNKGLDFREIGTHDLY